MKRGLRDATGRGVLTSLTRISEVKGCTVDGQDTIPCPGVLYYRGYDVRDLEARALDAALILHADHGSNNSTFTNHVTTSTGTDTYSAMTASLRAMRVVTRSMVAEAGGRFWLRRGHFPIAAPSRA